MLRLLHIMFLFMLAITFGCSTKKQATANYYFDPGNGNDSINPGTSPELPFKSLSMISKITVKPGDSLLLKSGAVFTDQLYISCRGDSGNRIVVGKFGGAERPYIKTGGKFNDGVHVFNSEYIVIRDLEISNKGDKPVDGMNGILVELRDFGTARDITIDNLYIHDVYGILVREHLGGGNAIQLRNYNEADSLARSSRFDGLLVQNCYIKDCQRNGIMMWGNWIRSKWNPSLHVVIRNNTLDGVPGKTSSSTRNFWHNNLYVGKLKHPGEGFTRYEGQFNGNLWYEKSDTNWNILVGFMKDKMITVNGKEMKILDIIGYENPD